MPESLSTSHPAMGESNLRDLTMQKRCLAVSPAMTIEQLRGFLRLFAEDSYRVKGFVRLGDDTCQVDCVGAYINVSFCGARQTDNLLVVLAGEGMPLRASLKEALSWYGTWVSDVRQEI